MTENNRKNNIIDGVMSDEIIGELLDHISSHEIDFPEICITAKEYERCLEQAREASGKENSVLFEKLDCAVEEYVMAHIKYYMIYGMRYYQSLNYILDNPGEAFSHYKKCLMKKKACRQL